MQHSHATLIQRLFDAFAAGDLATIDAALAPDVRSHTPGSSQLAGTAEGRDAVLAQLGRSRTLSEGTYQVTVLDVMAGEHHAAVLYRGTGTRLGRSLDLEHLALYAITDGVITDVRFVPLDQDAFDAFWS